MNSSLNLRSRYQYTGRRFRIFQISKRLFLELSVYERNRAVRVELDNLDLRLKE